MDEFQNTISDLGLQDLGFKGQKFMWSNGRVGEANIQICLDKALANTQWQVWYPSISVLHLPRLCSDQSALFVECTEEKQHKDGQRRRRKLLGSRKCGLKIRVSQRWWNLWDRDNPSLSFPERVKQREILLGRWDRDNFGGVAKKNQISKGTNQLSPETKSKGGSG